MLCFSPSAIVRVPVRAMSVSNPPAFNVPAEALPLVSVHLPALSACPCERDAVTCLSCAALQPDMVDWLINFTLTWGGTGFTGTQCI